MSIVWIEQPSSSAIALRWWPSIRSAATSISRGDRPKTSATWFQSTLCEGGGKDDIVSSSEPLGRSALRISHRQPTALRGGDNEDVQGLTDAEPAANAEEDTVERARSSHRAPPMGQFLERSRRPPVPVQLSVLDLTMNRL